jgi:hypothetical protein
MKVKKQKGWAAIFEDGRIYHQSLMPHLYFQKTKPTIWYQGRKLLMVPFTMTYKIPSLPNKKKK